MAGKRKKENELRDTLPMTNALLLSVVPRALLSDSIEDFLSFQDLFFFCFSSVLVPFPLFFFSLFFWISFFSFPLLSLWLICYLFLFLFVLFFIHQSLFLWSLYSLCFLFLLFFVYLLFTIPFPFGFFIFFSFVFHFLGLALTSSLSNLVFLPFFYWIHL